jgi:predicted transcriptional regulator
MVKVMLHLINNLAHSKIVICLSLKPMNNYELSKEFIDRDQSTIFVHMQNLRKNSWINNKNQVNHDKLTEEFIKYCREDIILSNTLKVSEQEKEVVKSIIKYSLQRCAELGYHKKKDFTISHLFNILKIKMFIDDDLREVTPRF